jgi:predicted NAD-dependent protein-ADP-ribosyltransferase YbiA (DUF1768 family)
VKHVLRAIVTDNSGDFHRIVAMAGDKHDPIYFYSKTVEYFELSNFSPHGFELDGAYWPTVEH